MKRHVKEELVRYAARFETASFIDGDPSWFMHQVEGDLNREATAFVASGLSFGSRKQFMPKISQLIELAAGDIDGWIRDGRFAATFKRDSREPFYRFYTAGAMYEFFNAYRGVLKAHGSLGACLEKSGVKGGLEAVAKITELFGCCSGEYSVVPKNPASACKRVCMFLRWMVRDSSPVDLGLWSRFIAKESLVMPLDTHVLQQSARLGLMASKNASMSAAVKLTMKLKTVFPGDPLKGDFALFGYGVN